MIIKTNGTQKESKVLAIQPKDPVLMHYTVDYDTTKPEETIRKFVGSIKGMLDRYEGNRQRLIELEMEIDDVEHYIEIENRKNAPNGSKLYNLLRDLRRERRACKSENDLLMPIWEYFHATEVLNRLTRVQGDCAKMQETIDNRVYGVRTCVLDAWLKPEENDVKVFYASENAVDQAESAVQDMFADVGGIMMDYSSTKEWLGIPEGKETSETANKPDGANHSKFGDLDGDTGVIFEKKETMMRALRERA